MNKNDALLKDIRERLSDFRYIHSLAVAESAGYLADKYGCDLFRKRMECAIMLEVSKALEEE